MDDIPTRLPPTPVRFMDRFRAFIRTRHLAYRTEKMYCLWVREFTLFNGKRHPESMGSDEVNQWLSYLANERNVAIYSLRRRPGAEGFQPYSVTRRRCAFYPIWRALITWQPV